MQSLYFCGYLHERWGGRQYRRNTCVDCTFI